MGWDGIRWDGMIEMKWDRTGIMGWDGWMDGMGWMDGWDGMDGWMGWILYGME